MNVTVCTSILRVRWYLGKVYGEHLVKLDNGCGKMDVIIRLSKSGADVSLEHLFITVIRLSYLNTIFCTLAANE